MAPDDPDAWSLAESREKRTRKATERGAERDAELERLRKARETKQLREQIAAEHLSQPQDSARNIALIFGAAGPTLTGDDEIDQANQLAHKANILIKALAHRTAIDYTDDYAQGKKTIAELEAILKDNTDIDEPTGKGKAKATGAMPERSEDYPGVIFGQSPQTVSSKHNTTTRYPPDPQQGSSKSTPTGKRTLDSDHANEASKRRRVDVGGVTPKRASASGSQPLGRTYPPLKRTDNSTIIFGKRLQHPQSAEGATGVTSAFSPIKRAPPKHAPVSPGHAKNYGPSPSSCQPASQPQPGPKAKPIGTIRVSAAGVPPAASAPLLRNTQPKPADPSSHTKDAEPAARVPAEGVPPAASTPSSHHAQPKPAEPSSDTKVAKPPHPTRPAPPSLADNGVQFTGVVPPPSRLHGSMHTSVALGTTPARPPAGHGSKSTAGKYPTHVKTSSGHPPTSHTSSHLAKGKLFDGPQKQTHKRNPTTQGSVPTSSSGHLHAGLVVGSKSGVSGNACGPNIPHLSNAGQPGGSKVSMAPTGPPVPRAHQDPLRPASHTGPDARKGGRNPTSVPRPKNANTEPDAPAQDDTMDKGTVQPPPIAPLYQIKTLDPNKPVLSMFSAEIQELLKLMEVRARGEVIATGTYDYSPRDPGEVVKSQDEIYAKSWAWACKQRRVKKPYRAVYGKFVDGLVTSYRGQSKGEIKKVLDSHFTFKEETPEHNMSEQERLLPDAFHHGDPDKLRDPFENPVLVKACRQVAFIGTKPWAIKFPKLFNPLPPRFIAFVLAISNHVIFGYRDGIYNTNDHLNVKQQTVSFRRYLKILVEMQQARPNAYHMLFGKMYDTCRSQVEKNSAPPPPIPSPPRHWSPDIDEEYVSKYAVPMSDESDIELLPDVGDFSDSAEPERKSEPEPLDYDPDDDTPVYEDEDPHIEEPEAGPSRLVLEQGDEQAPSDQEMAEFPDEREKEFDDDELTDTS